MVDQPAAEVRKTATFVFTDVEGSTELLRRAGDAYRALLYRHREVLREAFERHNGVEQGTEGDSFFVVFDTATEAVRACLDAQLAMAREPWPPNRDIKVRIGLHSGPASWDADEVVGLTVHHAARVMAGSHGGQIVASDVTRQLADVVEGVGWNDLGEYLLKDIDGPTRLFQLVHPELSTDFPPLRAHAVTSHNLPRHTSELIGRSAESARIAQQLRDNALVTLAGPGGIGKSRLAIDIAEQLIAAHADGVWLIELAPLTDPEAIASAIGAPFGIRPGPAQRATDLLVRRLAALDIVLLLDNCEHLIDACADVVATLLSACPRLTILATSREPLGVDGEVVVRIPALSIPTDSADLSALKAAGATALFLERASRSSPDFDPGPADLAAIVEICRRLDGMPLAIELAAARVNILSPVQIAGRLDDRFRLLTGGARRADARQQTLRAAVEWSYDLLNNAEQTLLRQLSVFVDDFSLEAVEGIARSSSFAASDILDLVASLVAKSLVVSTTAATGQRRYRLLETMRQFAADQLHATEEPAELVERHAEWYGTWAMGEIARLRGGVMDVGGDGIESERPNLLAALRWALDAGDEERALSVGLPLSIIWPTRDYFDEGVGWIERLLTSLPPSSRLGAIHICMAAMQLSHNADAVGGLQSAVDGLAMMERENGAALAWLRSLGLSMHAIALLRTGHPDEARLEYEASVVAARDTGDPYVLASALCARAGHENSAAARVALAEATEIYRSVGSAFGLCRCGWHQAELEAADGNPALGVILAREAVEAGRGFGPNSDVINALAILAQLQLAVGDADEALASAIEAFELAQRWGNSQVAKTIQDAVTATLGLAAT